MKQDIRQRRPSLTYNAILARVARQRAYDMGRRNYFAHVNPEGIGPNYLVTQAGYVLPDFYGKAKSANNVESCQAGSTTPEKAWESLLNSPPHRTSVLGLTQFSVEKTEYGIGHAYVPDSRYKHYWVVITAKRGGSNRSSSDIFGRSFKERGNIQTPTGKIQNVWVEHGVYENDTRGMRIHITFDVNNMKKKQGMVAAYFYFDSGAPLKDLNGQYKSARGHVSAGKNFTPTYASSSYKDLQLFIPYNELHMNAGQYQLKFVIKLNRDEFGFFAQSNDYHFKYSRSK